MPDYSPEGQVREPHSQPFLLRLPSGIVVLQNVAPVNVAPVRSARRRSVPLNACRYMKNYLPFTWHFPSA